MIKLSIIVPVYNEEKTVAKLLARIEAVKISGVTKEMIIVDDGSKDKTPLAINEYLKSSKGREIKLISHKINLGKGMAVRTGISKASGDYVVIQDADLEYDPKYLIDLMEPIKSGSYKVVYGTRLKRLPDLKKDEKSLRFLLHFFGNRVLSLMVSILFLTWLTDIETCYKIFPRSSFSKMKIKSLGFDFEPEVTIKLLKLGYKIKELPIKTVPRDYSQGKKLKTFYDGSRAFWAILKYRIVA